MSESIPQKVAIITGAGSGIGRATALAFLADGYAVALAGRRQEALEETAALSAAGEQALPLAADVTKPEDVAALFDATVARFGRVDVVFNNAGCNIPAMPLDKVSYDQWRRVLDSSATGAFLCTQAAFRAMKAQDPRGGRIINNGSISAHTPRLNAAPYTAAKHAITGLTKSTALDGRAFDIACGQIDIGNAHTYMTARMKNGVIQPGGEMAVEPTIDVDIVAKTVLYMASLPLDANVLNLTVMATKMPFVGRG